MKHIILLLGVLLSVNANSYSQAEKTLNKGGCGTKAMRARYASKAQIAGSGADGQIVAVNNVMLTRDELTVFKFTMEPGLNYDIHLILDPSDRKKLSPHPEAWGNAFVGNTLWQKLSKQAGTDLAYELPSVSNKQEVEIKFRGSNYFDLRDASMPEDVCAIIYAVKRKQAVAVTLPPVIKEKKTEEPVTVVPVKKPTTKNIIFSTWEQAKSRLKWLWLETPSADKNVYRYFSNNSLMVLQKTPNHSWTQSNYPRSPFPAYWNYEATFNYVKGESDDPLLGLMLPGTKNGEELKIMFTINPIKQTWFFNYYKIADNDWYTLVPGAYDPIFSSAINKYDSAYTYVANRLRISREGNEVLLYINNKLVQKITVESGSRALNKIIGVGITGRGKQGYYVTDVSFSVIE